MVTSDTYSVGTKSVEEKIFAAEKRIASVRFAVVAFNSLVYLFLMDKTGTLPVVAYILIIFSISYSIFVQYYQPYRKHPIFLTSYSTYGIDAVLITLWVWCTGGFESPFHLLYYTSVIAVSFRFSTRAIWMTAFIYSISYVALMLLLGEATANLTEITVRVGYIFCSAFLGMMISGETLKQMKQKRQMRQLAIEASEAEEKLRSQTQLYESLLKAQSEMGEGVSIIEKDKFLYVNDAFCKIFGYSEEDFYSMSSSTQILDPDEIEVLKKRHFKTLTEGYSAKGGQTIARKKDGTPVFITYSLKVMEHRGKKQLFSLIRDVTEEVRSREALLQTSIDLAQSKEMDKKKDEFIGVASHELKTPLTSINGYAQLLEQVLSEQLTDPDTAKMYVKKTQHQIDRLSGLINDLLDISRIQSGKLSFNMGEFDLGLLLEEICDGMQMTVRDCIIERSECFPKKIIGDRVRIEQVIINLLTNAIKYSPGAEKVALGMECNANEVLVYVKDYGIGIPPEDLEKVFERFYRVNTTEKKFSGLGIGLYISSEIIKMHNGRIWAESDYGNGATFKFTLPLERN